MNIMRRENLWIKTRANNWRKMHHFPMRRVIQKYKASGKKRTRKEGVLK